MVAAGLLDTPTQHAEAVTNMAFGMMEEAGKVMEPTNHTPLEVGVQCRLVSMSHCVCVCVLGANRSALGPSGGRGGGQEDA